MSKGRFGAHGGQYIPETLMNAVLELEEAYNHYKNDPEFQKELTTLLNEYAGFSFSNIMPEFPVMDILKLQKKEELVLLLFGNPIKETKTVVF